MIARKLLTLAAVSALLLGGVAAVSAASPGAMGTDKTQDEINENATENADSDIPAQAGGADDAAKNGSEAADRPNSVGPSDGLPDQVPDHVSEIHDAIESFLNDTIANLGETISTTVDLPDEGGDDEDMSDEQTNDDSTDTAEPADIPV